MYSYSILIQKMTNHHKE